MRPPVDVSDVPCYSGPQQPCSAPGRSAESTPQTSDTPSSQGAGGGPGGAGGLPWTFLHPLQRERGGPSYGGHDD